MKNMVEKGKIVVKKWVFRGKKQQFGAGKNMKRQQTRKAKWCKMQAKCQKMDKRRTTQGRNLHQITCELPLIFARTKCSYGCAL